MSLVTARSAAGGWCAFKLIPTTSGEPHHIYLITDHPEPIFLP